MSKAVVASKAQAKAQAKAWSKLSASTKHNATQKRTAKYVTKTNRRKPSSRAQTTYNHVVAAIGLQRRPNVAAVCTCVIIALAAAGTIGAVRAGTRKPRDPVRQVLMNYEAILAKQGAFKPDPVQTLAKGKTSYEDTDQCLRGVDQRFERLCKRYSDVDELRYQILQHMNSRSMFRGRALLVDHLLRNNGDIRDTCAELALAIGYHWRVRQLMGMFKEKIHQTFRRRSSSA